MEKPTIKAKKRLLLFLFCSMCGYLLLTGRLVFIELFRAEADYAEARRDS